MDTNDNNLKKRIAHIGGKQGEVKLQHDDVVYDIMKAMDDSMSTSESNLISYRQLHEAKSKKKRAPLMNNTVQYGEVPTNSGHSQSSKQMKKMLREKAFPLMAKCQKSWKFLKKNRCIPKPRAHVGIVTKPPQRPLLSTKTSLEPYEHSIFTESKVASINQKANNKMEKGSVKRQKVELVKTKNSSKKQKSSHSVSSSKNQEPDEPQFALNCGSDTDSEYEKFVQRHHLKTEKRAKRKLAISSESDVCSNFQKRSKIQKKKKKRQKHFENKSNVSISKITSKKLSDTEDSSETSIKKNNLSKRSPSGSKHSSKKLHEISNADTSDEDTWNEPVYDFDVPVHYDSSDDSEDKQSDVASLSIDKNGRVEHLNTNEINAFPHETNILRSNSVPELNAQYSEFESIKVRCNMQCYVQIKRDPIIEKKVVLFSNNDVCTNKTSIKTHFGAIDDDDDCIIVNDSTELNSLGPNPNEIKLPNKSISNLSSKLNLISETLQTETTQSGSLSSNKISVVGKQNEHIAKEMLVLGPVNPTDGEMTSSNEVQLVDLSELPESNEVQVAIGGTKQISKNICDSNDKLPSVLELQASPLEIKNMDEMEECIIVCEKTTPSGKEEISSENNKESHQVSEKLPDKNTDVSHEIQLENCKTALSEDSAEKSLFNVQILSVKSLNQSESTEIIDITEDTEETFCKAICENDTNVKDINESVTPTVSKTDDFDIEIICLDSNNISNAKIASLSKEVETNDSLIKPSLKDMQNSSTDCSLKQPVVEEQDDCIILDETDFLSKNTTQSIESNIPLPCITEANLKQQLKCDDKNVSNHPEEISKTSDNLNANRNASASKILKILDTIDFDTINRVVQATTPVANASILQSTDYIVGQNSKPYVKTLCEEKLRVSQNHTSNSENHLLLNKRNILVSNNLPGEMNSDVIKINLNEKSAVLSKKNETISSTECLPTLLNDNELKPIMSEFSHTGQNILQSSTVSSTAKDLISNNESSASDTYSYGSNVIQTDVTDISCNGTPLVSGSLVPDNSSTKVSITENVPSSTSNKACISFLNEPIDFTKPSSSVNSDKKNSELHKPVTSRPHSTSFYKEDLRIAKHQTTKQQLLENFILQNEEKNKLKSSAESPSDELDIIAIKSIQGLDEPKEPTVGPLLDLYKAEYKKYVEIKCTGKNVSAGLKLLQENQAKKLLYISLSIKNLVQHDSCLYKVANKYESCKKEYKSDVGDNCFKTENSSLLKNSPEYTSTVHTVCTTSNSANTRAKDYDAASNVKIFNPSVVQSAVELVGSKSSGSLNNKEVYNHLINSVCAECGKHALAACLSCAKVYYCSEECGKAHWSNGHFATCRR